MGEGIPTEPTGGQLLYLCAFLYTFENYYKYIKGNKQIEKKHSFQACFSLQCIFLLMNILTTMINPK